MTVGVVQREIHTGLTQDQVAEALGSPNIVTRDASGNETWIYDKIATEASYSNSSAYGTILDPRRRQRVGRVGDDPAHADGRSSSSTPTARWTPSPTTRASSDRHETVAPLSCGRGRRCWRSPPAACRRRQPPQTQLEVREYQTRTFDTADTALVMKAMFNVLQDDGYVVKNAVVELGLITAQRESDLAPGRSGANGGGIFGGLGGIVIGGTGPGGVVVGGSQQEPSFPKTEVRDFTGNVSAFGQQTKVRVSFQRKVLDNRGQVVEVEPVSDLEIYQSFFSRMDKSLFLQKENLG